MQSEGLFVDSSRTCLIIIVLGHMLVLGKYNLHGRQCFFRPTNCLCASMTIVSQGHAMLLVLPVLPALNIAVRLPSPSCHHHSCMADSLCQLTYEYFTYLPCPGSAAWPKAGHMLMLIMAWPPQATHYGPRGSTEELPSRPGGTHLGQHSPAHPGGAGQGVGRHVVRQLQQLGGRGAQQARVQLPDQARPQAWHRTASPTQQQALHSCLCPACIGFVGVGRKQKRLLVMLELGSPKAGQWSGHLTTWLPSCMARLAAVLFAVGPRVRDWLTSCTCPLIAQRCQLCTGPSLASRRCRSKPRAGRGQLQHKMAQMPQHLRT